MRHGRRAVWMGIAAAAVLAATGPLFWGDEAELRRQEWQVAGEIVSIRITAQRPGHGFLSGTLSLAETAVPPSLAAGDDIRVGRNTLVYQSEGEGRRNSATLKDLREGQKVEIWMHRRSGQRAEAYEITIAAESGEES